MTCNLNGDRFIESNTNVFVSEIVDVIVFDQNKIYIVTNIQTNNTSKIFKLQLNSNLQLGITITMELTGGNNKILYEKT